jgi:capsid protein
MRSAIANPIEWFNDARSDYAAVKRSRMKRIQTGMPGAGSHADYHYRSEADYLKMIEIARDFDRNDPVVGQGFGRVVANVVQNGFTLDAVSSDASFNAYITDKWLNWANDRNQCDSQGELSFARMESLVFRSVLRDGDIFAIPLRNGSLRLYEGHRPRTPNGSQDTIHGVQLGMDRRRVALKIAAEAVSPWATVTGRDVITIPWRDALGNRQVFHVYNPDRVTQTRGVSVTHAISDMVGMHDDVQFANLVRQQVVSCFAVMRERSPQFDAGTYGDTATGPTTQDYTLGTQRILEQIAPGMILSLIHISEPTRPCH